MKWTEVFHDSLNYQCCVNIVPSHSVITKNYLINYKTVNCTMKLPGNLVNHEVMKGKAKGLVGRMWSLGPKRPLEVCSGRRHQVAFQCEMQTSRSV
jgi:hypothetical protein